MPCFTPFRKFSAIGSYIGLAMTDELTQVANRRSMLWFAEQVRQRNELSLEPWCLVLIDIDFFKQCNDNYGHDAGDQVLQQTAQAIKSH